MFSAHIDLGLVRSAVCSRPCTLLPLRRISPVGTCFIYLLMMVRLSPAYLGLRDGLQRCCCLRHFEQRSMMQNTHSLALPRDGSSRCSARWTYTLQKRVFKWKKLRSCCEQWSGQEIDVGNFPPLCRESLIDNDEESSKILEFNNKNWKFYLVAIPLVVEICVGWPACLFFVP